MAKERGRRIPRRSLEDTRALVLSAVDKGLPPDDAARIFEVGRSTIFGWLQQRRLHGPEALKVKKAPGPVPRLTDRQKARLRGMVLGKDPRQFQLDFAMWTRKLVRDVIVRKFDVELSVQQVGNILHELGLSPQRPLVRAYEQDPERVRRWKEEQYPAIHAEARKAGATIYFADEAGVRTDHHTGTTWGAIGRTPVVTGTGSRLSVNMISSVSAQGKMHFSFFEGNMNAQRFIAYLKDVLHDVPGKIFLIVDGAPAHRAAATKEFVESTDGRLTLFLLPPYSPELNPDEWVWKNVKHDHVGRAAPRTAGELKKVIKNAIDRLHAVPELIIGFFADPHLSYIHEAPTKVQ
ncbi:MAG: IS630 family transposase [Longimicrobiales bacterium]